ncbi:hypothetical protein QFC21_006800 [Naganishia friedmannii]|uniref:Uncharacterized protein n=1 Tax=Naganishia friedmannii TaxID=89922 RepID=A0ACC2V057_9TREE|nr:hypothetical protein QFC21_006800 [Naganishia friedmannii]
MRFLIPFLFAALASTAAFVSAHTADQQQQQQVKRATTCNGHAELCGKGFGNVTFLGTHNSYAVGKEVADNQGWNVTEQLNDGIRLLQVQTHLLNREINLCHSSCSLQSSGPLSNYLSTLSTWLAANPTEIVTLLITNPESIPPSTFGQDFVAAGLDKLAYSPASTATSRDEWPTLGAMIDQGKRLVVFMDYNADFGAVPYIIDEFSNVFEDAYDTTSQDFPCTVNRTSGSPETTLMLTNHYLDYTTTIFGLQVFLSDKSNLTTTNSASGYGSIGQGVANCVDQWKRNPNFVLVDWYDSNGNTPFDLVASLNGVAAPTNTVKTSELTSGTSSSSSSSSAASRTGSKAATSGTTKATGTTTASAGNVSSSSLSAAPASLRIPAIGTLVVTLLGTALGVAWVAM